MSQRPVPHWVELNRHVAEHLERINGSMVQAYQAIGALIADVQSVADAPEFTPEERAELRRHLDGWRRVKRVFTDAGFPFH